MSEHAQDKLNRYVEGYRRPGAMQEPPGRSDEPQLAALDQYLQTKNALAPDDIVLDFGSGRGILADRMEAIWPDESKRPWYYAVDQKPELHELALSPSIHNHSQKVDSETFLQKGLEYRSDRIKVVVVRNVFHELHITETAQLLFQLRHLPQAELYVQDMVTLPRGERLRAGWHPDLFRGLLHTAGFKCETRPLSRSSFTGTEWFALIAYQNPESPPELATLEQAVYRARFEQREAMIEQLVALSRPSDKTEIEHCVILQIEVAAISTQLQQYDNIIRRRSECPVQVEMFAHAIPLLPLPRTKLDYAEEVTEGALLRSGLVGVLSSGTLIDFPALLAGCKRHAYFMGYAVRRLFQNPPTREALVKALKNGVHFKLLLVGSPEVTRARAESLLYESYEDLVEDIKSTYRGFKALHSELPAYLQSRCELRFMLRVPPCHYFVIDDFCCVSLHSLLSGGSGPCLVFRSNQKELNSHFAILLQEFQLTWDKATKDPPKHIQAESSQ